jgi:hypothetical protein
MRIRKVGRQCRLAVARVGGGRRNEQLKRVGGGGGHSDNVGGDVAVQKGGS